MEKHRFVDLVPLVCFTVLSAVAAGLMVGIAGFLLVDLVFPSLGIYLGLVFVSAVLGLAVSLFHLGKKLRFMRAVVGVNHSWLSREVVVAGMFAVGSGCAFFLRYFPAPFVRLIAPVCIGTAVLGILLAVTIGLVYRLPTRQTWRGVAYWLALPVMVLLLGSGFLLLFHPSFQFALLFLLFWVVDAALALWRTFTFRRLKQNPYSFLFPRFLSFNWRVHLFRLILSLMVLVLVVCSCRVSLVLVLIMSLFLDRLALYLGMAGIEPASEIARIKSQRMKDALK